MKNKKLTRCPDHAGPETGSAFDALTAWPCPRSCRHYLNFLGADLRPDGKLVGRKQKGDKIRVRKRRVFRGMPT